MARKPRKQDVPAASDDALVRRVLKLSAGGSVMEAAVILKAANPSPTDYHRCVAEHPALADAMVRLGGI